MSKYKDRGWRNSAENPGTQWRTIPGMIQAGNYMRTQWVTVRITDDKNGKGLSLSDDKNVLIYIPLEPIAEKLREVLQEETEGADT